MREQVEGRESIGHKIGQKIFKLFRPDKTTRTVLRRKRDLTPKMSSRKDRNLRSRDKSASASVVSQSYEQKGNRQVASSLFIPEIGGLYYEVESSTDNVMKLEPSNSRHVPTLAQSRDSVMIAQRNR